MDPAELKSVLAAMPETVTAYHSLPPVIAPFPGALRVAPIAKDKINPGLWSIHRRPGARPNEGQGYYVVWAAGGIR